MFCFCGDYFRVVGSGSQLRSLVWYTADIIRHTLPCFAGFNGGGGAVSCCLYLGSKQGIAELTGNKEHNW